MHSHWQSLCRSIFGWSYIFQIKSRMCQWQENCIYFCFLFFSSSSSQISIGKSTQFKKPKHLIKMIHVFSFEYRNCEEFTELSQHIAKFYWTKTTSSINQIAPTVLNCIETPRNQSALMICCRKMHLMVDYNIIRFLHELKHKAFNSHSLSVSSIRFAFTFHAHSLGLR